MKASLLLASLALALAAAVSAQAQTTAPAPASAPAAGDFGAHKTQMLAHIDARMAAMTKMRDCVNAAASRADLKTCRSESRGEMHSRHAPA